MTNSDQIVPEGVIVETRVASRVRKNLDKIRPKAALGNMKTHLYLSDRPIWITVGRKDLEDMLEYIAILESKQTVLLKNAEERED